MSKQYKFRTTFTFNGKRYVVRANSERELIEKRTEKLRDLREGKVMIGPNMTVKSWAEQALATYKPNVSDRVMESMQLRMNKHIYSAIGNMPIRSVKPMHCQQIMNAQIDMSFSHIRKLSQELHFIFRTAVENKIILENPADHIVVPSGKKGSRRSLTETEKKHFLTACDLDPAFNLFLLMYYCGCRPAEAIGAIGKDIETTEDGGHRLHIRGTKTENANRYVPIPDVFYQKVKDTPPFSPIAPNRAGRFHTESSYDRLVSLLKRQMNISMGCKVYRNQLQPPFPLAEDFVPYCLRHTYCTNLAKSGVDVRTAQRLMGHANIQITANIYTHVDDSQINKAADLINQFFAAQ